MLPYLVRDYEVIMVFKIKGGVQIVETSNPDVQINTDPDTSISFKKYCGSDCFVPSEIGVSRGGVRAGWQVLVGDAGLPRFGILKDGVDKYIYPATVTIDSTGNTLTPNIPFATGVRAKSELIYGTSNMNAVLVEGKYKLVTTAPMVGDNLVASQYIPVGSTNPSSPVTYRAYEDIDSSDPSKLLIEMLLDESLWDGKVAGDEIKFDLENGPIVGIDGEDYYIEYISDNPFSLYGNGTYVNASIDLQPIVFRQVSHTNEYGNERGVLITSSGESTSLSTAGQWYKLGGTWHDTNNNLFTTDAANKLTYNGDGGIFDFSAIGNCEASKISVITLGIYKNGTLISETEIDFDFELPNKTNTVFMSSAPLDIVKDDYFEVWAKSSVVTTSFKVNNFALKLTGYK